ncbi:MAG TPA: CpsD/CapB family tyrosine-protein kinase [bacterium]|nr:CpsD/CapB family tyrosine-protein kinase [bacterium]
MTKELPPSTDQSMWRLEAMDQHLVSLVDPASFEADQYRTLRHLVEQLDSTKRVIAVTSALPGDGKTMTALNLAGALAHASQARILVWDLDLRTPSVGKRLGLSVQNPGSVDLIVDPGLTLNDVVRRHPQFPIWVMAGGGPLLVPYEVLKSPRLAVLLREAREQYDYVVVDTAPLTPVPDSRLIADRVDGFVMVVAAHRTPRKFLEDALNLMDPGKVIGIVFNRDDRRLYGYYGSYYGYGRRAKRGRKPHAVLASAMLSRVTAPRDS